jgi:biopolymer transport protein ExbB
MKLRIMIIVFAALCIGCGAVIGADEDPGFLPGDSILLGEGISDIFEKGGILMWPILLCSIVGLSFILERFVTLRRSVIFPKKLYIKIRETAREGKVAAAITLCEGSRSSFAKLLNACLRRAEAPGFEMETALEEAGSRELYDLRKNGRPLAVIADVSPLLGLMGTVVGMIKAFEVVAKTGALGRTELLAEGIGEALVTTAAGLSVAIPAMIAHQYFRAKAEGLMRTMEDASIEILVELRKHKKNG